MRGIEGAGHLGQDPERALQLERPFLPDQRLEVHALDVPHGEVQLPVGLPGFEDRDDVGVIQGSGQPRLPNEPFPELGVL